MDTHLLEWIGYLASGIIALSMTLSSILKFRWVNLAGALIFSAYGFLIGALPVGFMNAFIAAVDIYYLTLIYAKKEVFETLGVSAGSDYMKRFVKFHERDIHKFFPGFVYEPGPDTICILVLRNMAVAGVFLAHPCENQCLRVSLDYVLPEFRDFKNGKFIYLHLKERFTREGFKKVIAEEKSRKYGEYLQKTGFMLNKKGMYEKML